MNNDLSSQAINFALSGNWKDALTKNKAILKINPQDLDALNRIARCYAEMGKTTKAVSMSKKVLAIDPFNQIATKCLAKWRQIKKDPFNEEPDFPGLVNSPLFIEEPGKTKTVNLTHPAASRLLNTICCGEEVMLNPVGCRLSILTMNGKYLGRLPDYIGLRLKNLIKGGNSYKVYIKSVDNKNIKVFIKEDKKSTLMEYSLSFPLENL